MQIIGKHKVTNLSIENPSIEQLFVGEPKASIFYSDPPWGNVEYWTTIMQKQTGTKPPAISFDLLLKRVIQLAAQNCSGMVFIEQGLRWQKQVVDEMLNNGLHSIRTYELTYEAGKYAFISAAVPGAVDSGYVPPDVMGGALSSDVIKHHAVAGGIVFDPCCGMGYSARAAVGSNMRFFGNELNPARLAKTVKVLQKRP